MTGRIYANPGYQAQLASGPQVEITSSDYNRLVETWTRQGKRRSEFPRRLKPRLSALHYILQGFDAGVDYVEEDVNTTIAGRNPFRMDYVQIRRFLVDYGMLGRRDDGSLYRVTHTYLALARWDSEIPGVGIFQAG